MTPGSAVTPMMLDVMMMLPPSFMSGSPYLQARNDPRTLMAMTWSKTSSGYSVTGASTPEMPAWLKMTSIWPKRLTVSPRYICTSLVRDTSADMAATRSAMGPSAGSKGVRTRTEARASSRLCRLRPTSMTFAPSCSRSAALANPMLPAPPVTTQVLPVMMPTCGASLWEPFFGRTVVRSSATVSPLAGWLALTSRITSSSGRPNTASTLPAMRRAASMRTLAASYPSGLSSCFCRLRRSRSSMPATPSLTTILSER